MSQTGTNINALCWFLIGVLMMFSAVHAGSLVTLALDSNVFGLVSSALLFNVGLLSAFRIRRFED